MKQEFEELLLKDLCGRLPYGVKVSIIGGEAMSLKNLINSSIGWYADVEGAPTDFSIDEIKPYLRPMSSMTEEEQIKFSSLCELTTDSNGEKVWSVPVKGYDWLNANHFDYRGLTPMGLALEAKEGMYEMFLLTKNDITMEGYKAKVYPQGIARLAIDNIISITQTLTKDSFAKQRDKLPQEDIKRLYNNLEICKKTLMDLVPADPKD